MSERQPGRFLVARPHPVWVRVSSVKGGDEIIDVATWLREKHELTPELTRFLLEWSARARVGKLGVDRDGEIVVEHSLFPEQLGCEVLRRVVDIVSTVAAEIEHELTRQFPKTAPRE